MPKKEERRSFLKYSALGFLGAYSCMNGAAYQKKERLRPPGAVSEKEFLALCIKCGQCLQACPYHSIKLGDISRLFGIGTPYIDARERGCYLCELLPCVLACPTGALSHDAQKIEDVKMGTALFSPKGCLGILKQKVPRSALERVMPHPHENEDELNILKRLESFEGKECTICADMCPLPEPSSAIEMISHKDGGIYPLIKEGCVGCGVCEELCPAKEPAITIKPKKVERL